MRLGILGGSFDPPHIGHLILASRCAAALDLDEVRFLPAYRPPHKRDRVLRPFEHRLEMARLATAGVRGFTVSTLERDRGGLSYTADTLTDLHTPGDDLSIWLLLGRDSLDDLPNWRDPDRILRQCRLAVYARPGYGAPVEERLSSHIDWVGGPQVDVSSSQLREDLAAGRPVRFLVPAPVCAYIERHGLYPRS